MFPIIQATSPISYSTIGCTRSDSAMSITSSDSSSDLCRTASISSNNSSSTAASTAPPSSPQTRSRRAYSGSSDHVSAPLHKKPSKLRFQESQTTTQSRSNSELDTAVAQQTATQVPSRRCSTTEGSDLVVRCKSDVYHVDKIIMCYQSRWFTKVCNALAASKAPKCVIDISADDPDAVAAMIQYCYQLDYTDHLSGLNETVPELTTLCTHVNVFMLAERYGISGLQEVALQKFAGLAEEAFMEESSEQQFLQALPIIYTADRGVNAAELQHVLVRLCADRVESFINGGETDMSMVFDSMNNVPDFRVDLFDEMASRWR